MEKMKERKQQKESNKDEQTRRIINQKYINIKCEEKNQKKYLEKQIEKVVKQQIENKVKYQKGITLLALVITIIVLLILAGITISAITGDNGIIGNAGRAKEEAEIANEKEILEKATVQAMGNNKYGNIEEAELQEQLDKETGKGKTEATDIGEEFEVIFKESNRYYTVDKDGNVGDAQDIIKDQNPGDITVGIDGKELAGTEAEPYEIWCIEDLVAFSNMVNGSGIKLENGELVQITTANNFSGKYVALKTNLNFKSKLSYQNSERTDFGDINGNADDGNTLMNEMTTGTGYKPIGIIDTKIFNGKFDGKNYKINNIYIQTTDYAGLFGILNGNTTIQNLEISGEVKSTGHTGGIVGEFKGNGGMIHNCINKANIEGNNEVGGIIGYNNSSSTIRECKNYGDITIANGWWAYAGIGGIVGASNQKNNTIENCENYGKVGREDSKINTGGIIGTICNEMAISGCSNYGEVISNSSTGGIAGWYRFGENVKIYNSRNLGNIKGAGAGGIIGSCNFAAYTNIGSGYIENCYNIGEVQATGGVGGIVGSIGGYAYEDMKIYINNCYNIGNLSGSTIGGIVGGINNNAWGQKAQYLYVNQVYYLNTVAKNGIGRGNTDEGEIHAINNINTTEFVNTLNNYKSSNGQYPAEWKKWKLGEEGYPVFE